MNRECILTREYNRQDFVATWLENGWITVQEGIAHLSGYITFYELAELAIMNFERQRALQSEKLSSKA